MVTYENFKGTTYYLHEGKTKKGNSKYFFSKEIGEPNIDRIPIGYKIYENNDGQVFLVNIKLEIIKEHEVQTVKNSIEEFSNVLYFRVSSNKDTITISTDSFIGWETIEKGTFDSNIAKGIAYVPMLRFVLLDEEAMLFGVERYCFRGSVDSWIPLGAMNNLKELSQQYCSHLGRISFYDLV